MDVTASSTSKLLLALTVLLALSACTAESQAQVASLDEGGGPDRASAAASEEDDEEQLVKWTECMRENGIDMPDPAVNEDGGMLIARRVDPPAGGGASAAADPFGEDFRRAREECGDPPRVGGALTAQDRRELQENALKLAQCMREEGINDFPDPDFSSSGPGTGPREAQRMEGPFGGIDLDDPDVQAAFEVCREKMPGGPLVVRGPAASTR